jgi:hypothetical protein
MGLQIGGLLKEKAVVEAALQVPIVKGAGS